MRRFRFRLAPLLRLREQLERAARRDLAVATAAVEVLDRQLAAAERGLRDCSEQAVRTDAAGRFARALETGLLRHQWRLARQQKGAQQKLDVARADYAGRARELRTLERLFEQQHAAHRTAAARAEQAELDELAMLGRACSAAAEDER